MVVSVRAIEDLTEVYCLQLPSSMLPGLRVGHAYP